MEPCLKLAPTELEAVVARLVARCSDIRAAWSLENVQAPRALQPEYDELLLFGDATALQRLRASAHLHRIDVDVLVVFDGDRFENAWGRRRVSGSLARWAWRHATPALAYFDESRWAHTEGGGEVVRVRRKATLLWSAP
jgi:hypothetical protein